MTSEKDYNKHKTEKQLSQLKDRSDKEGVGTHSTSAHPFGPCTQYKRHSCGFGAPSPTARPAPGYAKRSVGDCSRKWKAQISTHEQYQHVIQLR